MELAYELRPRGVGELVDAAFQIYRKHWWTLVKTAGLFLLPFGLISSVLQALIGSNMTSNLNGFTYQTGGLSAAYSQMFSGLLPSLTLYMAVIVLQLIAYMINDAAMTKQAADVCLGETPTTGSAWRAVRARLGTVLGASLLSNLIIYGVGIVTCCCLGLGALVFFVFLALVMPAVMLESASAGKSIGRSFSLVQKGFWHACGVLVVLYLILLIPTFLISLTLQMLVSGSSLFSPTPFTARAISDTAQALIYFASILVGVILAPLQGIGKTLIYLDLRVRHEGYDLERAMLSLAEATVDADVPKP